MFSLRSPETEKIFYYPPNTRLVKFNPNSHHHNVFFFSFRLFTFNNNR